MNEAIIIFGSIILAFGIGALLIDYIKNNGMQTIIHPIHIKNNRVFKI